ncbi:MAG: hypothetical protein OXE99_12340 [Cellvibrionales bacterium]|nr:hypothetical protein [Cellvibrionales bacterium]
MMNTYPVEGKDKGWLIMPMLVCSLIHLPLSFYPLGRDQGVWLSVGSALLDGKLFVSEILHFNLPGLGLTFAFFQSFISNPHVVVVSASVFSCLLIIVSGFYLIKHATTPRTAQIFSWAFAIIYPLSIDYYNIAQKDMLAMSWLMVALAVFLKGQSMHKSSLWFVLSGLSVALSVFHKPVFGIVGIFLALLECLRYRQHHSLKTCMLNLTLLFIGFAIPIACYIAYLWINNALHEAWMALQFAAWYSGLTDHGFSKLTYLLLAYLSLPNPDNLTLSFIQLALWFPLTVLGLYRVLSKPHSRATHLLWLLISVSIFTYYIQGKGFPYQAFPVIVSGFIVLSIALDYLVTQSNNKWWLKSLTLCILAFLLIKNLAFNHYSTALLPYLLGKSDRITYLDKHYHPKDSPDTHIAEAIGRWLDKELSQQETIHIWGMENYIYTLANRSFPTRHHFHFFLYANLDDHPTLSTWQDSLHQAFIETISAKKPAVFIEAHYGGNKDDRYLTVQSVSQFPPIYNWLETNYRLAKQIDRLDIWVRKDLNLPPLTTINSIP